MEGGEFEKSVVYKSTFSGCIEYSREHEHMIERPQELSRIQKGIHSKK